MAFRNAPIKETDGEGLDLLVSGLLNLATHTLGVKFLPKSQGIFVIFLQIVLFLEKDSFSNMS
jgi:hypothetical protein